MLLTHPPVPVDRGSVGLGLFIGPYPLKNPSLYVPPGWHDSRAVPACALPVWEPLPYGRLRPLSVSGIFLYVISFDMPACVYYCVCVCICMQVSVYVYVYVCLCEL